MLSGAPKGERNGAYRTGEWTDEARAGRRAASTLVQDARVLMATYNLATKIGVPG